MKLLVAYASRMGSNAEIAHRIGRHLTDAGHVVDVRPCSPELKATPYEGVVLGSALYVGRWDRPAVSFLHRQAAQLAERPTWLFQSGPCGDGLDLSAVRAPRAVRNVCARSGLAAPVTFGGRLDPATARSSFDRWVASGTRVGDFRDWEQISAWTWGVVRALASGRPVPRA